MEILVPGLILVALMVYASTRIKKIAARAYDREDVSGEGFSITKPAGFIIPAEKPSEALFFACSKEYGRDAADGSRQAEAKVVRHVGPDIAHIRKRIVGSDETLIEELSEYVADVQYKLIETAGEAGGLSVRRHRKLFASGDGIMELCVTVLAECGDELAEEIEVFVDSFRAE